MKAFTTIVILFATSATFVAASPAPRYATHRALVAREPRNLDALSRGSVIKRDLHIFTSWDSSDPQNDDDTAEEDLPFCDELEDDDGEEEDEGDDEDGGDDEDCEDDEDGGDEEEDDDCEEGDGDELDEVV